MRQRFQWDLGNQTLALGERTLVMGVVNVTPDSFSDGGSFRDAEGAVEHALKLLEEGADLLDVGGESTRPGVAVGANASVSAEEELRRVVPVIEGVRRARPGAVISIDTYKAETAKAAVAAGATIVNDVSGLHWDEEMAGTLAGLSCGVVLMHSRGKPAEWRQPPGLEDPVGESLDGLRASLGMAESAGISRERIVVDPGFGFGKRFEENYPLIAHFGRFAELGYPVLAGPSRKSFLGKTISTRRGELRGKAIEETSATDRLFGTLAAVTACVLRGAHVVRVHDVREAVDAVAVADAILKAE